MMACIQTHRWDDGGITLSCRQDPSSSPRFNPGEPRAGEHLLDHNRRPTPDADQVLTFDDRVSAVEQAMNFQNSAEKAVEDAAEATEGARTQILLAREWLKECTISDEQIEYLVQECMRGVVQGHAWELFAVKAAKALAALDGRASVNAEDLKEAVKLVIIPRAKAGMDVPPPEGRGATAPAPAPAGGQHGGRPRRGRGRQRERGGTGGGDEDDVPDLPEEFFFDAEGGLQDKDVMQFANSVNRREGGRSGRSKNIIFQRPRQATSSPLCRRVTSCASPLTPPPHRGALPEGAPRSRRSPRARRAKKVYVEKGDMRAKKLARSIGGARSSSSSTPPVPWRSTA